MGVREISTWQVTLQRVSFLQTAALIAWMQAAAVAAPDNQQPLKDIQTWLAAMGETRLISNTPGLVRRNICYWWNVSFSKASQQWSQAALWRHTVHYKATELLSSPTSGVKQSQVTKACDKLSSTCCGTCPSHVIIKYSCQPVVFHNMSK